VSMRAKKLTSSLMLLILTHDLFIIYLFSSANAHVDNSPYKVGDDIVKSLPFAAAQPAAPIDKEVGKWFYIAGDKLV
jgi:hypothetical protein